MSTLPAASIQPSTSAYLNSVYLANGESFLFSVCVLPCVLTIMGLNFLVFQLGSAVHIPLPWALLLMIASMLLSTVDVIYKSYGLRQLNLNTLPAYPTFLANNWVTMIVVPVLALAGSAVVVFGQQSPSVALTLGLGFAVVCVMQLLFNAFGPLAFFGTGDDLIQYK